MIKGNESLTGGGLTSYAIPNGRNVLIDNRIGVEPADTAALSLAHRGTEEGYTILSDRIAQDLEDPRDRVSNKLHICVLLRPGKHASHMAVLSAIGALAAVYAIKNNSDHKPMTDVGSYLALIEKSTGKKPFAVCGKPYTVMGDCIKRTCNLSSHEIAMFGDRLATDITFGVVNDFVSVMVLTGEATLSDAQQSGLKIDYILPSIVDWDRK